MAAAPSQYISTSAADERGEASRRLDRPQVDAPWGPTCCGSQGAEATDVTLRGEENGGVYPILEIVIEVWKGLSSYLYKRASIKNIGASTT